MSRGRRMVALVVALLVVVVGAALAVAPLVDRWGDPAAGLAAYCLALLAVYGTCMHVLARPR